MFEESGLGGLPGQTPQTSKAYENVSEIKKSNLTNKTIGLMSLRWEACVDRLLKPMVSLVSLCFLLFLIVFEIWGDCPGKPPSWAQTPQIYGLLVLLFFACFLNVFWWFLNWRSLCRQASQPRLNKPIVLFVCYGSEKLLMFNILNVWGVA